MSNQEVYKKICGYLDAWEIENDRETTEDGAEAIGFSYGSGDGRATYVMSYPFSDDELVLFVMGDKAYKADGDKEADGELVTKVTGILSDFNSRNATNAGQTGKLLWNNGGGLGSFVKYIVAMPEAVYANPASIKSFLDEVSDYFTSVIKALDGNSTPPAPSGQPVDVSDPGSSDDAPGATAHAVSGAPAIDNAQGQTGQPPAPSATPASSQTQPSASVPQPPAQATPFGSADSAAGSDPKKEKWAQIGWGVLSFCFPIVGIVLYFVWKKEKPELCKTILWATIAGFVLGLIGLML